MNKKNTSAILSLLSDGQYHSGQALGQTLSITRSAVWKTIKTHLMPLGIEVESAKGQGYRIPGGIEYLCAEKIRSFLNPTYQEKCPPIHILQEIDSTNAYLLKQTKAQPDNTQFCLTEQQTKGRGRRARQWHMGFMRNIALSCLWHFPNSLDQLSGLSLVAGIAIANALQRFGAHSIGIKWPNDIVWQHRKLAGIAVEVSVDNLGACYAVIGIGLNVHLSKMDLDRIEQIQHHTLTNTPVDLQTIMGSACSRNQIAGLIIDELLTQIALFKQQGFAPFQQAWHQYDILYQQTIDVHTLNAVTTGTMCGIDEKGGLILKANDQKQHFYMGEVSVRKK